MLRTKRGILRAHDKRGLLSRLHRPENCCHNEEEMVIAQLLSSFGSLTGSLANTSRAAQAANSRRVQLSALRMP